MEQQNKMLKTSIAMVLTGATVANMVRLIQIISQFLVIYTNDIIIS